AVAVGCQLRGGARDASGPEVLDALDHTGVEELETALDEDLLCEGVTDLQAGRFEGFVSSKDSEARIEVPPMPSPPVRAPKSTTLLPSPEALARRMSSWRS